MHYYQFNIKTYIASTAHLTNGEDLAYRRLIDHYYDTELPIPTALPLLCRRLRLALPDVESVLNEFFIECEDGWRHSYIDNEIKAYKTFIARQKANGSKGGRASNANANPPLTQTEPTAKPTSNNKPITNNHKPIKETAIAVCPINVQEQVWEDFLALRKVKKAPMTITALAGIKRESDKANWDLNKAISECVARGWIGFKAEWVEEKPKLVNRFDVAHVTVPSSSFRDPALVKLDEDSKRTSAPNPENLARIRAILGKTA